MGPKVDKLNDLIAYIDRLAYYSALRMRDKFVYDSHPRKHNGIFEEVVETSDFDS